MFIIFLTVVILYAAACFYVGFRFIRPLATKVLRISASVVYTLFCVLFFAQRAVVGMLPLWLNDIVYTIGTMWLVVVMYGVMLLLVLDLGRLMARLRGLRKPLTKTTMAFMAALLCLILFMGYRNAVSTNYTRYEFSSQNLPVGDTLTVAVVSDLHMGYAIDQTDIQRMVDMVNASEADMCVIAGDLVDGDLHPVVSQDLGRPLDNIVCPTYAVVGNHEYIGGVEQAEEYLRSLRLTLLRDSSVVIGGVNIIGRDDLSMTRTHERRSVAEMKKDSCFNIVVDHQPGAIDESVGEMIDLHLSGHTHAGQVWPIRALVKKVFDMDYGFKKQGMTHIVVTSGFGTWGPRMRLGSHSEVVLIKIVGTR